MCLLFKPILILLSVHIQNLTLILIGAGVYVQRSKLIFWDENYSFLCQYFNITYVLRSLKFSILNNIHS